jgi:hypothetical protein
MLHFPTPKQTIAMLNRQRDANSKNKETLTKIAQQHMSDIAYFLVPRIRVGCLITCAMHRDKQRFIHWNAQLSECRIMDKEEKKRRRILLNWQQNAAITSHRNMLTDLIARTAICEREMNPIQLYTFSTNAIACFASALPWSHLVSANFPRHDDAEFDNNFQRHVTDPTIITGLCKLRYKQTAVQRLRVIPPA